MKLAIVGCGDVGYWVARLARLNRKIKVVACVDPDYERARRVARVAAAGQVFRELSEPFGSEQAEHPDAVYLGVPHHLHLPLIRQCRRAGAAVLCEKPLAHTIDDAREIVELSRDGGPVGVNYQYRYDHGCYSLIRACANGELGGIRYIRCNIPWHRESAYFGNGGWHARLAQAGGGTLITQGSHFLDIALICSGGDPVSASGRGWQQVFGETEVEDLFVGHVETSTGVVIEITSSMVSTPEQRATIEVYGSSGTGIYGTGGRHNVRFRGVRSRSRKHPVRFFHALGRSIEGFRRWVDIGQPYECPAAAALPVMDAVNLLYRSARNEGMSQRATLAANAPPPRR